MKKIVYKISLDILMLISYSLLMFGYNFGGLFHEILGIITGILFILHFIFNTKMIKTLFKKTQLPNQYKNIIAIVLDITLIIAMPIVVISGIFISYSIFDFATNPFLTFWHNTISWIGLIALSGHALLHINYVIGVFKKIIIKNNKQLLSFTLQIGLSIVSVVTLYKATNMLYLNYTSNETPTSDETINSYTQEDEVIDEDKQEITIPQEDQKPTLEEFISKLFCNGCGRHCPLTNLHCRKGQSRLESSTQEYYSLYPTNS
ncbi:MAG: cytochrome b/b6 domain-containing protein [Erysipelotrichaceae bacterium]